MATINLGLVKGLFPQTTAPTRTDVTWLDTSVNPNQLKTYNASTSAWEAIIKTVAVDLAGSTLSRPEFEGLSLEQIQTSFRLFLDGNELITLEATTLVETDTLDFGFEYTATAFLVQYISLFKMRLLIYIAILFSFSLSAQTDSDFPPAAAYPKSFKNLQVTLGLNVPYMVSATDSIVWVQAPNDSLVRPVTLSVVRNNNALLKDNIGWASYTGTNYTLEAPLEVLEGDTALIEINAASSIETYKPTDIETLWNSTDDFIVGVQEGATYLVRLSWKEESSLNDGRAEVLFDIGSNAANVIPVARREFSLNKGLGIEQNYSSSTLLYSLDTFMANGCKVKIISLAGTTSIYDVNILITVLYRP